MTETLSVRALNRATLARQLLLARESAPVAEAVARLCGMQAQEPKPPFLGLWTRISDFQAADLHAAVHDRTLVRATMMRATLHLVTATDYTAFRSAIQPMLDGAMRVLGDRAEGLDLEQVVPAARALLEKRPRTFNDVRALLQAEFPDVNDRALGYAVRMCVPLVMVPTQDRWAFPRTSEFALADTWLDTPPAAAPEVDALMLRYLAAFGPASAADAQAWSGLTALGEVFERLRPDLRVFADDKGRELFDLPDAPRPPEDAPAPARFLPEFDNLVLAHADRRRVISDRDRPSLTSKNLRVRSVFLWDGFAHGIWDMVYKRKVATMTLRPFEPLPSGAVESLTTEGHSLLRFTEPDAKETVVAVAED
ncbi:winged helix DNA-binding domain-containing protein [Actinomadura sp. NEAU-AAG7]|uniref:winged helix DNA-binding domain-containing protein n=1 Tax=Actinomadura sp. NEAU-AAG7 TaxID=2839640 RepID=UPI001BE40731|nr:winged helix DNA-binding domain-containing protein [Actinomadura sp. NEAU-AAG7]MBT2214110.1 winged helix DNA-binding domain-containing protein [Actinomadura sp. NEAU-AAG7]